MSENVNEPTDNFNEQQGLSIATPGVLPVFDGSKTETFLVLNNYTDKIITDVRFHIDDQTHPNNATVLSEAPDSCSTMLPHSSCRVEYSSPRLSAGKLDAASDLFVVTYKLAGKDKKAVEPIGYQLVYNDNNANGSNQVVSMGSPEHMTGNNGTSSAMIYFYVKGDGEVTLDNEEFDVNSFTVEDKNFTDSTVAAGTVLTYEVSAKYNQTKELKSYLATVLSARFTLNYTDNNVNKSSIVVVANTPSYINGPYIAMQPIPSILSVNGNSESFMVYNVGSQPTSVLLTSTGAENAGVVINPSSFSLGVNGSQLVTLNVNNIGASAVSGASITATASSNTVIQPLVIIGGPNQAVISPPYNFDLQQYAPTITQQLSLTNSSASAGNIKLSGIPTVTNISGTNASFITATTNTTAVSTPCSSGTILAPGQSCNYNILLKLNVPTPTSTTYSNPYRVVTSVGYTNSQDNYSAAQTMQAVMSGNTYYQYANVLESGMPSTTVTIEGNNYDAQSFLVTFTNNTSTASSGSTLTQGGTVTNIVLESTTVPSFISLSTAGVSNPCNIGTGVSPNNLPPLGTCNVKLLVGPYNSKTPSSGTTRLTYNYLNNVYQGTQSGSVPLNYILTAESLNLIIESVIPIGKASGSGATSSSAWIFSGAANGANQNITVWYKNAGNESILIESFPNGPGVNGTTFWTTSSGDSCTGTTLIPNGHCSVVYQQNFYNTIMSTGTYNCNGTSQSMNISSPNLMVKAVASSNEYTIAGLVYPVINSNTIYATESNIYILNYLTANYTGTYKPGQYNNYTSQMYSTLSNASGYTFTLNIPTLFVSSGFGIESGVPTQIMTGGMTGSCSPISWTSGSSNPTWGQGCTYTGGAASGNMGESAYNFSALPSSMSGSIYFFTGVSISSTNSSNQVYCVQDGANNLSLP